MKQSIGRCLLHLRRDRHVGLRPPRDDERGVQFVKDPQLAIADRV